MLSFSPSLNRQENKKGEKKKMRKKLKRRRDKEYEVEAVFSMNIYELLFSTVVFVDEIEITPNRWLYTFSCFIFISIFYFRFLSSS